MTRTSILTCITDPTKCWTKHLGYFFRTHSRLRTVLFWFCLALVTPYRILKQPNSSLIKKEGPCVPSSCEPDFLDIHRFNNIIIHINCFSTYHKILKPKSLFPCFICISTKFYYLFKAQVGDTGDHLLLDVTRDLQFEMN